MCAVAGQEPALEVDAPHVVRAIAIGKRCTRRRAAPAQTALHRQSFAIEQRPDRTRSWPGDRSIAALKIRPHLNRPPARMLPAHRKTALRNHRADGLRVNMRRARAIDQTLNTGRIVTLQPLVAGLAAYAEPPAQRRKRLLTLLPRQHKSHPFV